MVVGADQKKEEAGRSRYVGVRYGGQNVTKFQKGIVIRVYSFAAGPRTLDCESQAPHNFPTFLLQSCIGHTALALTVKEAIDCRKPCLR